MQLQYHCRSTHVIIILAVKNYTCIILAIKLYVAPTNYCIGKLFDYILEGIYVYMSVYVFCVDTVFIKG
jgi:hypothetical protein